MSAETEEGKKEITGKVIGIMEYNNEARLNILLNTSNLEIKVNKKEYKLGETLELDVEIRSVKKKYA